MKSIYNFGLMGLLLCILSSCYKTPNCTQGLSPYYKVSLYFGTSYPGGVITDSLWQQFLDESVTPNFPEGMTIYDTRGQWQDYEGYIIEEPGKVISHIYKSDKPKVKEVEAVILAFKQKFEAQSVIWEEDIVCIRF